MVTMKKAAIFGCGLAGKRACLHFRTKYRIVAFLDNDPKKHGSRVLGVPVRSPEGYDYSQAAHVFIASMYLDEILVQLLALGVPSAKIEYVSDDILMRDPVNAPAGRIGFRDFLTALRRAFYLPLRLLR
jgi:FlaA1/EpsC-like NDP-sugar epimerase